MIDVEAPSVAPPSPPDRRPVPWLIVTCVPLLASSLFPWERYCGGSASSEDVLCFSARLWSGSASLLGIAAILLLTASLVVTAARGWRSKPGALQLGLASAAVTAIASKAVIVTENHRTTLDSNDPLSGPAAFGSVVGAVLALGALVVLLVVVAAETPPRRRPLGATVGAAIVVVGLAIPYSWSGLAWWGGPLVHPRFLGGGNGLGMRVEPDRPYAFQGLLYVHNLSSVPVVLDRLELMDRRVRIRVLGTFVVEGGTPCPTDAIRIEAAHTPEGCVYPLRGYRMEPGDRGDSVMLGFTFEVPDLGVYRSGWFRIGYHAGPLRYEVFRVDQLVICAPEPGRKRCPGAGL